MKAFTFQAPPNILFEAGASQKLAELVAGYGVTRILLVTDKGVRNAGLTRNAEKALIDGGCELTVVEEVEADPPSHVIERAGGRRCWVWRAERISANGPVSSPSRDG